MFLTTVRVRRARRATMDRYLTTPQLQAARGRAIVEVMAHGEPIALVDAADTISTVVLWKHTALHDDDEGVGDDTLERLVDAAQATMQAVKQVGLTDSPTGAMAEATP